MSQDRALQLCLQIRRPQTSLLKATILITQLQEAVFNQEVFTVLNIYASSDGSSKYFKHLLTDTKKDVDSYTMVAGNFGIPFPLLVKTQQRKTAFEGRNQRGGLADIY